MNISGQVSEALGGVESVEALVHEMLGRRPDTQTVYLSSCPEKPEMYTTLEFKAVFGEAATDAEAVCHHYCIELNKKYYLLGTFGGGTDSKTHKKRVCEVIAAPPTKKRKRTSVYDPLPLLALQTMERAVLEYQTTGRSLATPFERGTSFVDLFGLGPDVSDTLVRAYYLWFQAHPVERLAYELKHFSATRCTVEELEKMNKLFYTLWCTTKKQMMRKLK